MARQWNPDTWDADQGKWGSAGLIYNGTQAPGSLTNGSSGQDWNFDPKYMRMVQQTNGDGPDSQRYEHTDYFKKLLGGKVQVRDLKRLKDRNAVTDGGDEVGWLTDPSNYTDDTDGLDKAFELAAMAGLAGPTLIHALGGMAGGAGVDTTGLGASEAGGAAGSASGNGLASLGTLDVVGAGPGAALEGLGGAGAAGGAAGAGGLSSALGGLGVSDIVRGGLGLASVAGLAGGGGGSGGSGGGATDASSIIDQMANANRVDMNTPIGSRKWNQGADGRWTVNDTMNPAEQANFEGVQGLNAGVTGMTRDRLAQLLANPKKSNSLSYGQFNIGD
jgi:hypothetical protein